jgi:hypothetical protein
MITEENKTVSASTELELSAALDDVGPRPLAVDISFEFNRDTNPIDHTLIQPDNKMENGKFSGTSSTNIVKIQVYQICKHSVLCIYLTMGNLSVLL